MSSLCLEGKKEKTHIVSHAKQDRRFKIETNGIEEKGSDYQNDDKDDLILVRNIIFVIILVIRSYSFYYDESNETSNK